MTPEKFLSGLIGLRDVMVTTQKDVAGRLVLVCTGCAAPIGQVHKKSCKWMELAPRIDAVLQELQVKWELQKTTGKFVSQGELKMSKAKTQEQVRKEFLTQVRSIAEEWGSYEDKTPLARCKGVAFSIMALIDGCSASLPAMAIVLLSSEGDREFYTSQGEDWYEDGMCINENCQLHDLLQCREWEMIDKVGKYVLTDEHMAMTAVGGVKYPKGTIIEVTSVDITWRKVYVPLFGDWASWHIKAEPITGDSDD